MCRWTRLIVPVTSTGQGESGTWIISGTTLMVCIGSMSMYFLSDLLSYNRQTVQLKHRSHSANRRLGGQGELGDKPETGGQITDCQPGQHSSLLQDNVSISAYLGTQYRVQGLPDNSATLSEVMRLLFQGEV